MIAAGKSFRGAWWSWPLLTLACGCASLDLPGKPAESITHKRQQRSEQTAQEVATQRDFAEFQAAAEQWNRHDVRGCRQRLQQLLKRNPRHRDASLLMTEMALAEGRPQVALRHVQQALAAHPDDAEVLYTMGLVLDASGQCGGALGYYQRAAQRAPGNELYALGFRSALEAARPSGPADASPSVVADGMRRPASGPAMRGLGPIGSDHSEPAAYAEVVDGAESAGHAALPDTDDSQAAGALLQQGATALAEGAPPRALELFQQAVAACQDNPQIPISAAIEALRHNQPDLAVALLEPSRERFSHSARIYRTLGVAHYRRGDYRSSQLALQQALSLDKSSELTYALLRCTLAKLGG
ncbi:MAG: tetratricopeptide repeat protein [Pirellulales bacterium]|nr:tetratricopeptide repeat protein [Pirellulales bacterium]